MSRNGIPPCLWDFCAQYVCELRCLTAHNHFSMHRRTPYELDTGQTPDISECTEFRFYEPVWYYDEQATFPEDRRKIGRWLGVAHRIGQALCYFILSNKAQPIVRSTVQKISQDELQTESVKIKLNDYEEEVKNRLDGYASNDTVGSDLAQAKLQSDLMGSRSAEF